MSAPDWIDWAGGYNPTPITAVVEVRHRDGAIGSNRYAALAGGWDSTDDRGWIHNGSGYDIVAYRVFSSEAEQERRHEIWLRISEQRAAARLAATPSLGADVDGVVV